ncbi:hypothetical protein BHE74_00023914 [Ensete ventricosum]|nr:hypothetical protein GW17_00053836 [Ensete ventricosum]RWW68554.1 hypothetical protein BHE74_00023914 [Ensete ventricosum]RZR99328.1 hypothetical protein BHM03_00028843 [Ensete ventricosum]
MKSRRRAMLLTVIGFEANPRHRAPPLAMFSAPLWIAVLAGLLLGWAWRPGWAAGLVRALNPDSAPSPQPPCSAGPNSSVATAPTKADSDR